MAFCTKCGNQLVADARFCSKCGAPVSAQAKASAGTIHKGIIGEKIKQNIVNNSAGEFNMSWHKFMIYVALFANALLFISYGGKFISGTVYGEAAEQVYYYFGSRLKTLDTSVGLLYFALAAFCVFTRFQLANFKRNAPKMLVAIYAADVVIAIVYSTFFDTITGVSIASEMSSSEISSSIVGSIVGFIINMKYYKKRESLFVN